MPTDPNWLISTAAQSAAAFVAIIAGFIVSRLLALSAERNGLEARIREIEIQYENKVQNLSSLQKRILEWDILDFLEDADVFDKIIEFEGEVSLIDAMKRATGNQRSEDEIRPYWEKTISTTKSAFNLFREHSFEPLEESENLDLFLKDLELNLSQHESKIYHRVYYHLLSEYEKKHNPLSSIISPLASMLRMPSIHSTDENNRYRLLERDIELLQREKSALENQASDLKFQLRNLGKPEGVTLGVVILAYFSFAGIVVPLFLLPSALDQFTYFHKWSIFLLFVSGLILFFVYLFRLIQQLTK